jgi:asparagine synthase (glutamine-hydrolysing)
MCGICGKLNLDLESSVSPVLVKAMADTIAHRGPDDEGFYYSGPVGFGFRRLSIIDLNLGHQPLSNEDGSVWVIFNGEIYNYQALTAELVSKGHVFKTKTDTEVIVHLYEEYGEGCVEKLRGMFAFAIWDDRRKELLLARDRVGIKPLYYWQSDRTIVFGSEIKSILIDPAVSQVIDPRIIDRFLSFYFVPGEETLFKGIHKLLPGNYLVVRNGKVQVRQYWDLEFSESDISLRDAEARTLELLDECVRMHMISDVPVGFLLSGGVDSTALLNFSVGKTTFPLSSYTLGFAEPGLADERPYARLAAEKYGSTHHEMTITAKDFMDFMPKYVWHMEEPVCEPQAVALYYVSKMAAQFVKVLISGEGGDEAFAGYPIYRNLVWLERLKKILGPFNGPIGAALLSMNGVLRSGKISKYAPLLDRRFDTYYYSRTASPGNFFNRSFEQLYTPDFRHQIDKDDSVGLVREHLRNGDGRSLVNRMLYADTKTSLPDDLLLKADKMTMANSLELRVPFLDHKLLEFAASLPSNFKVRRFSTKYVAKKAMANLLPVEILKRKKVGFPVPYESWLRKEMQPWVRDVLLDGETVGRGYFNKARVEQLIRDHAEYGGFSKELLSLTTLELWHRAFRDPSGSQSELAAPAQVVAS